MSIAFVDNLPPIAVKSPGSEIALTLSDPVAVDTVITVEVMSQHVQLAGSPSQVRIGYGLHHVVRDSKGNPWARVPASAAPVAALSSPPDTSPVHSLWLCKVRTALEAGDEIRAFLLDSSAILAMAGQVWSVASGKTLEMLSAIFSNSGGASNTIITDAKAVSTELLRLICVCLNSDHALFTFTPDGDYTALSLASTSGGSAFSNMALIPYYRIHTTNSDDTHTISVSSGSPTWNVFGYVIIEIDDLGVDPNAGGSGGVFKYRAD